MSLNRSRLADRGSAASPEADEPPVACSPPLHQLPSPRQGEGFSQRLFRVGTRPLHSLRRLKELEEEDVGLSTPHEEAASTSPPGVPPFSAETFEGPPANAGDTSESDDDTFEVVRSMKDLQRMRGGPRKGLDVRLGLEETTEAKEEEETEEAGGLLERNFATGGPVSAADRHL